MHIQFRTILSLALASLMIANPALAQSIDLSPVQNLLQGIVDTITGPLGIVIGTLSIGHICEENVCAKIRHQFAPRGMARLRDKGNWWLILGMD